MNDTSRALPPRAEDAAIHAARGKAQPARGAHPLGLTGAAGREHVDLSIQGNRPYRCRHRTPVTAIRRERDISRIVLYRVRHRLRPFRRRHLHLGSNGREPTPGSPSKSLNAPLGETDRRAVTVARS